MRYIPFHSAGGGHPFPDSAAAKPTRKKSTVRAAPKPLAQAGHLPSPISTSKTSRNPQTPIIAAFTEIPDATVAWLISNSNPLTPTSPPDSGALAIRRADFIAWIQKRPNETFRDWREAWQTFTTSIAAPRRAEDVSVGGLNPILIPDFTVAEDLVPSERASRAEALSEGGTTPIHKLPSSTTDLSRWRTRLARRP